MSKESINTILTVLDYKIAQNLTPATTRSRIPGFTAFYTTARNKIYRCTATKTVNNITIKCQCIITEKKAKKLSDDIISNLKNHTHCYPTMSAYIESEHQTELIPNMSERVETAKKQFYAKGVEKAMCIFVGQNNLPLKIASCPEMAELLNQAFILGQKNIGQKATDIIKLPSRTTFTKHFIDTAEGIRTQIENDIKNSFPIISLMIDAGKIGSQFLFEATYMNPFSKKKPMRLIPIYKVEVLQEQFLVRLTLMIHFW